MGEVNSFLSVSMFYLLVATAVFFVLALNIILNIWLEKRRLSRK